MNDPNAERARAALTRPAIATKTSLLILLLVALGGLSSSCGGGSDSGGAPAVDPPAVWDTDDWDGAVWQ